MHLLRTLQVALEIMILMHLLEDRLRLLHLLRRLLVLKLCVCPTSAFSSQLHDIYILIAIRFGDSPFFSIDQAVSSITECPGIV